MKKIASLITSLLSIFALTACSNSVEYNGVEYRDNFYPIYFFFVCGIKYNPEEPLFQQGKYDFWYTEEFAFPLLYCSGHKETWHAILYTKNENYKETKKYYADDSNFNFYISDQLGVENNVLIENEEDKTVINGVIDALHNKKGKVITAKREEVFHYSTGYTCYKKSKDGLLTTYTTELSRYKDGLYLINSSDSSKEECRLRDLGGNSKALYSIFAKNNLI